MIKSLSAAMAELVDALDSGSSRGNSVDVRVILAARILWGSALAARKDPLLQLFQ